MCCNSPVRFCPCINATEERVCFFLILKYVISNTIALLVILYLLTQKTKTKHKQESKS